MENGGSMFGGPDNINKLLGYKHIWETYHDKGNYIAGVDPIPMPDDVNSGSEHVLVIKGARGEYEPVTKMNIEYLIEKYRHVLTPEHIKVLRESVNDDIVTGQQAEFKSFAVGGKEGDTPKFAVKYGEPKRLEGKRAVFPYKDELDVDYVREMQKRMGELLHNNDEDSIIAIYLGSEKNLYPHVRKEPVDEADLADKVKAFKTEVMLARRDGREPDLDFLWAKKKL